MTANTLRRWVIPELTLVDLASRSTLSATERERLSKVLAQNITSSSNVTGGSVTGAPSGDPRPPGASAADDPEPEG